MNLSFRHAEESDLAAIVALLSDDVLGSAREIQDSETYLDAFRAMADEPHNSLIVGVLAGAVVAVYQFTLISGVSISGTRRAQIEGVRVAAHMRGQGIGAALLANAEERARAGGAGLLQFTTNRQRDRAQAFYQRMGFVDSHIGFKKTL